ncbi:integrin alpha-IIb-like [Numida meleagris]|uniref:integrin alpha-IIb-like n=1 Tax=Numida meleagris TaxID=8996 RepID=UPI000B3DAE11|nr:integrin alpha-IIb-like [Numida meleagris]
MSGPPESSGGTSRGTRTGLQRDLQLRCAGTPAGTSRGLRGTARGTTEGLQGNVWWDPRGTAVRHPVGSSGTTGGCTTRCHPQLHNKGPAAVTGVTLLLRVPVTAGGRELLRLREPETEGEVTCEQLEAPGPAGAEQRNGTGARERGDAGDAEENVTVDCASARCSEVRCRAARLAQGQRVLVSVRALLGMDALRQQGDRFQRLSIHSWGSFNVSAMPYRVQPHTLPHGAATAVTEVLRSRPAAVPVWWVVLGVLAGVLLLALLVLLMGKLGFFKRTRPPAEGDTGEVAAGQGPEPGDGRG